MTTIRATTWNTYAVRGYSHQVGTDGRATGGVHLHQIRKGKSGWQRRTVDSNGQFESAGPVSTLSATEGEALFEQAKAY